MDLAERIDRALLEVYARVGRRGGAGPRTGGDQEAGQLELGFAGAALPESRPSPEARRPPAEPPGPERHPQEGPEGAARRVEEALRAEGGDVWETFEYALRSNLPVDADAAAFAALALLCGPEAASDRSRPEVRAVRAAAFKVRREAHRLLGFLRFAPDPGGVYSAACEPDHDVLDLLAPAFLLRFGGDAFRIADLRRGYRIESDGGRALGRRAAGKGTSGSARPAAPSRAGADPREGADPGPEEAGPGPEELWRAYYRAAENPARTNPRLRLQFVPRRYWKFLPELDA